MRASLRSLAKLSLLVAIGAIGAIGATTSSMSSGCREKEIARPDPERRKVDAQTHDAGTEGVKDAGWHVIVDERLLPTHHASHADIVQALGTAGYEVLDTHATKLNGMAAWQISLRSVSDVQALGNVVIGTSDGREVRLRDVAMVEKK